MLPTQSFVMVRSTTLSSMPFVPARLALLRAFPAQLHEMKGHIHMPKDGCKILNSILLTHHSTDLAAGLASRDATRGQLFRPYFMTAASDGRLARQEGCNGQVY